MMGSLSDKLRSLGVKVGARDIVTPARHSPNDVDQVIPGRWEETPYGKVFVVERHYPTDVCHGDASLKLTVPLGVLAEWTNDAHFAALQPDALVFLDTETTGLATGTGTFVFMVGVGRYDGDSLLVTQFFMRDPSEELAMLHALERYVADREPAQCGLVTFNGKGFDVPMLDARYIASQFIMDRCESPLAPLAHLDLLQLARRLWRERLTSRSLGSLEEHILRFRRTEEDIPGWLIPTLYFDYLREGDARPLKGVFYHNAMDILSMAALLDHIAGLLADPLCDRVHPLDLVGMGKIVEHAGDSEKAARLYGEGLARVLPPEVHEKTVKRLSFMHKRQGNIVLAIQLWQEAANQGQLYAHVELAKFYEHQARDYPQAIRWTEMAIALLDDPKNIAQAVGSWLPDLQHRLSRLQGKLSRHQRTESNESGP